MSDDSGSTSTRRTVLKSIGSLSAVLTTPAIMGSARTTTNTQKERYDRIPESIARQIAISRIEYNSTRKHFSHHNLEGLAQPELFYSVTETGSYRPAAWVYPIRSGGEEGHVAVSARPDSPEIIRYSTSIAPQTRLRYNRTIQTDIERSENRPRFIYHNPMSFGVEVSARNITEATSTDREGSVFLDLKHGYTASIDAVATQETATQNDAEITFDQTTLQNAESTSFRPLSTGSISGVPNWNANLCGSDWVGCTPAASSMCIGHHENTSSRDCDLMWELHDLMGTNTNGETWPRKPYQKDFVDGINDYETINHDYSGSNTVWGRRSEIKDQIDSKNPCVLSHWWNGDLDKGDIKDPSELKEIAVGHSETVFEYEKGDDPWWNPTEPILYVTTHDTYGGTSEFSIKSSSVLFLVQSIEP